MYVHVWSYLPIGWEDVDCCSELGVDIPYHSLTSGHTHTSTDHTHRLQLTVDGSTIINC